MEYISCSVWRLTEARALVIRQEIDLFSRACSA
jgi:hypothetical protein